MRTASERVEVSNIRSAVADRGVDSEFEGREPTNSSRHASRHDSRECPALQTVLPTAQRDVSQVSAGSHPRKQQVAIPVCHPRRRSGQVDQTS